jgi:ferredoxin-NADP reductase
MSMGTSKLPALSAVANMFAWPLRTSHYLELVNPLWTSHALRARVEEVTDETAEARTLTLRPGRGWRVHRPGQYVSVGVSLEGRQYVRTYSISSPPERADGCITVTVKAVAGGRVSTHLVRHVTTGTVLSLGLPQGDFVLPDAMPVRPLFITAGSGITPVMSMLRSLLARETFPDVVHVHYAPRPEDVIFAQALARLAERHPRYRLHLVHTRIPGGQRTPHFTAAQLQAICPDWTDRDSWVCGPRALLADVETHWRRADLAHRLHVERFQAALAEVPADAAGGRVTFRRSGVACDADGQTSLLRVAEDAGLNPPHGCRMGICHSCTATIRSGCVRDLRSNVLVDEPGARVQLCVSAAGGPVDLDL